MCVQHGFTSAAREGMNHANVPLVTARSYEAEFERLRGDAGCILARALK
jgi:hypothetical protein